MHVYLNPQVNESSIYSRPIRHNHRKLIMDFTNKSKIDSSQVDARAVNGNGTVCNQYAFDILTSTHL